MKNRKTKKTPGVILIILLLLLTGCDVNFGRGDEANAIQASGIIEMVKVNIASEIGGRVSEVYVSESDKVQIGDELFRIEDPILEAQKQQAEAAIGASEAMLKSAHAVLETAKVNKKIAQSAADETYIQYQIVLEQSRLAEAPERAQAWVQKPPAGFVSPSWHFATPPWYFTKPEEINAAKNEADTARQALEKVQQEYTAILEKPGNEKIKAAEERLADAQAAFVIANEIKNRKVNEREKDTFDDQRDALYDQAKDDLEDAQKALDDLLSKDTADELLEARARLAIAQERWEIAQDRLRQLNTGEKALPVLAAEARVQSAKDNVALTDSQIAQAQAGVQQAQKAVEQAQAALGLINIQMEKLVVHSAAAGVVMTRNIEPGEVIQPGFSVMTIGQEDQLTLKVYIPEDEYGRISLGDRAIITVDSYPDKQYNAVVNQIAEQAEFTPRNVQTKEDRQTLVFAIQLAIEYPQGDLKPGMPADVVFSE